MALFDWLEFDSPEEREKERKSSSMKLAKQPVVFFGTMHLVNSALKNAKVSKTWRLKYWKP